jgi:hypothetical protein
MGPVRTQRCPVRLHAPVLSLRRQTHPAAFLGRFSPLLEADYLSDVADAGLRALARKVIFERTGAVAVPQERSTSAGRLTAGRRRPCGAYGPATIPGAEMA